MEHFSFIKLNTCGNEKRITISSTEILVRGNIASLKEREANNHGGKGSGYLQRHY